MPRDAAAGKWFRYLVGLATFVTVILVVACLYWARSVLIPVALSILLTFVLAPVVTRLQGLGLSRVPAVLAVVTLVGLLVLGLAWITTAQLAGLIVDLPSYQGNISAKLNDVHNGRWSRFLEDFRHFLNGLGGQGAAVEPQPVRVVPDDPVSSYESILTLFSPLLEYLAAAGLVIVLVLFMLIKREDLRNRVITLAGLGRLATTTKALDEAGQRISRYLLMQLIINGTYGIGVAVGLWLIGLPYAMLWGMLAGTLRYIPYVGPWIAALMPILLGLAVFDGWAPLLGMLAFFIVLELVSNMIMEPLLYGQSIGVSEAALLVAVAFWTWLWGPIGLVLSVPLTVCLVVLGKYVPALKCFDILLGERLGISPAMALYQRLLAGDREEASAIITRQRASQSAARIGDETLIPALLTARRDLLDDHLEEEDFADVLKGLRELAVVVGAAGGNVQDEPGEADVDCRELVLGCPVRDESEEVALHMLSPLLDPAAARMVVASGDEAMADLVARIDERKPAIACLLSLPPGGLAIASLSCRRLRARFPELGIVVCRWGDEAGAALRQAGADLVAHNLQDTLDCIQRLLQAKAILEPAQAR